MTEGLRQQFCWHHAVHRLAQHRIFRPPQGIQVMLVSKPATPISIPVSHLPRNGFGNFADEALALRQRFGRAFRIAPGLQKGIFKLVALLRHEQHPEAGWLAIPLPWLGIDHDRNALTPGINEMQVNLCDPPITQQGGPRMGLQKDTTRRGEQSIHGLRFIVAVRRSHQLAQRQVQRQHRPRHVRDEDRAGKLIHEVHGTRRSGYESQAIKC